MKIFVPELLAPAGSLLMEKTAFDYGDLVYCYNLFNLKTNQKFIKRYNSKFDCFEDYELKALSV